MIITAHGGALKTGRNTKRYFDTIADYAVDAIEVDIRKKGETLYLSHILPKLSLKGAITMEFVLNFCLKEGFKVNCDVKQKGLVKPLLHLAKELGATECVYFTGALRPEDADELDGGAAYVNTSFYRDKFPLSTENLEAIKTYLDSFDNPRIQGINIPYRYATEEFLLRAKALGLGLSIYTVDDPEVLKRLIPFAPDNITTNIPDVALELARRNVKK